MLVKFYIYMIKLHLFFCKIITSIELVLLDVIYGIFHQKTRRLITMIQTISYDDGVGMAA